MIQVLLVDDDTSSVDSLSNFLSTGEIGWDLTRASTADEAMGLMADRILDVVIVSGSSSSIDAADLLARVRESSPDVMRILVLRGESGALNKRLIPQAHQIVQDANDLVALQSAVERAYDLSKRMLDPELRRILGKMTDLPRPPQSVIRLNAVLADPESGSTEVAEVIGSDMAVVARTLQVVNSSQFGLKRIINDLREAVSFLGMNAVRDLAVSIEVSRALSPGSTAHGDLIEAIHDRANNVASLASRLVTGRENVSEAFISGLLHEVGMLAIVSCLPDRFEELLYVSAETGLPIDEVEIEVIGASHPDLGAYLLDLWGLPFSIVEAVARHRDAMDLPRNEMTSAHAVCIARAMIASTSGTSRYFLDGSNNKALDSAYLSELGVLPLVESLLSELGGSEQ